MTSCNYSYSDCSKSCSSTLLVDTEVVLSENETYTWLTRCSNHTNKKSETGPTYTKLLDVVITIETNFQKDECYAVIPSYPGPEGFGKTINESLSFLGTSLVELAQQELDRTGDINWTIAVPQYKYNQVKRILPITVENGRIYVR